MTADLLMGLLKVNLAASVLILLVLAARRSVRRAFGARAAYGLWAIPVLGAIASLLPARIREVAGEAYVALPTAEPIGEAAAALAQASATSPLDLWTPALALWIAGVAVSLGWLAVRQARFLGEVRRGRAGPAVVGFLRPRIVAPSDFESRFDAEERAAVLAHELAHLRRQDARVVALAVLMRCLNWFNPLVHLAVFTLRIDQELACDAQVIDADPGVARVYAETMFKAQLAAHPLPLGCAWPAGSSHPLAERIALIAEGRPGRARVLGGAALAGLLSLGCGVLVWAAQPPRLVPAESVPERALAQSASPQREGPARAADASRFTAARQLLAEAVPSEPEGETMMLTQRTQGSARRLAGAAVVATIGLGTGAASAQPAPTLTNSQPAVAAPAPTPFPAPGADVVFSTEDLGGGAAVVRMIRRAPGEGPAVTAPAGTAERVVVMSGQRPAAPPDPARQAALNAALGLPADAKPKLICAISGRIPPGGDVLQSRSCSYQVAGGPPTPIPPEVMARMGPDPLMPPPPPIMIPRPPTPLPLGPSSPSVGE